MTSSTDEFTRYPLLDSLLAQKGLAPKGIYTIRDAAQIFGVSAHTLLEWARDGKLVVRDLPGRGRFLSDDLELFLQRSLKGHQPAEDEIHLAEDNSRGRGRVSNSQRKRILHGQ